MGIIKILDEKVVNKIAAGEVIVGSASVLKELLENSIDAGSKNIIIDIGSRSNKYIKVKDDGCGMVPEDIPLAFVRNSTSKIKDDIDNITTLGFRGEALASISYVSKIDIITKTKNEATAKHCKIIASEIIDEEETSHNTGTEITVYDLFYNLPVRAKHMRDEKSDTTEMIAVTENISLSHPEISFILISNNKQLFSTPGNGKIYDTLYSVFGKNTAERLMPFQYEDEPMFIKGMLSAPNHINERSPIRLVFVNGRYVKMPGVEKSIDFVYDELFAKKKAEFVLYISLPENMLDVNVHPSKLSIKFYNESLISLLIRQGVRDFLKNNYILKEAVPKTEDKSFAVQHFSEDSDFINEHPTAYENIQTEQIPINEVSYNFTSITEEAPIADEISLNEKEAIASDNITADSIHPTENKNIINKNIFAQLTDGKFLGNAFGLYALIEYGENLYAVDTHAAHERVLYENYLASFNEKKLIRQDMMVPVIVPLTPKYYETALLHESVFYELGFEISDFSDNSILIRSIPHYFTGEDIAAIFNKLLVEITENSTVESITQRNEALIKIACHNAVRGSEDISVAETKALLKELYDCDYPYACPHGRPTVGKIKQQFFMKVFERI